MKIIKKGIHPQDLEYEAECITCGTVFTFERKEGKYHPGDFKDVPFIQINCPLCGNYITVNT